MSTTDEGGLKQLALDIQKRNRQFQQKLTEATLLVKSNPEQALVQLDQSWEEASQLEQDEFDFLGRMGDFGAQQIAATENSWREIRLQIQFAKAQSLVLVGKYEEAQSQINHARSDITDLTHPAALMLDELEINITELES